MNSKRIFVLFFISLFYAFTVEPTFELKTVLYAKEAMDPLKIVTQAHAPDEKEIAYETIYRLNHDKTEIYGKNLELFQKNILNNHPVILALFSSQGGKFILYRPHKEPLVAPEVPKEYQVVKSVGHSTLSLYSFVIPFVSSSKDQSWKNPLESYLLDNRKALASVDLLESSAELKAEMKRILSNNIKFIEKSFELGKISLEDVKAYTNEQAPSIRKLLLRGTSLQVGHWVEVLKTWKKQLGQDFEKTYAVVSAVYVTRSRNVLFTIMAQFFREKAFNDRLFLFETTDFAITPEAVLNELTRVVSDRVIGELFFGGKYEMDVELLGKAARQALKENEDKLPEPILLPPLKPASDIQKWPW